MLYPLIIVKGGRIVSVDLKDQYDKLFRYCFFKVRDRAAAEDMTQETFLRFLESPHYRNMNKELHYLYTIAGNLCKDHFRKRRTAILCHSSRRSQIPQLL